MPSITESNPTDDTHNPRLKESSTQTLIFTLRPFSKQIRSHRNNPILMTKTTSRVVGNPLEDGAAIAIGCRCSYS